MEVILLQATPLSVADIAICKCYGNTPHHDVEKAQKRIYKVANVSKHASTIEHINFSFDIDGISRSCLQELARHRIASYTVKSSRYTLQELKNECDFNKVDSTYYELEDDALTRASKYVILTDNNVINESIVYALEELRCAIVEGIPNDIAKYCMPEAYKTSLVMTINARALQNFLELRTSKHALWEIQELAKAMYEAIPSTHKFLFEEYMNDTTGTTA